MAGGRFFDRSKVPGYGCVCDNFEESDKTQGAPVEPDSKPSDDWWSGMHFEAYTPEGEFKKAASKRGGYKYVAKNLNEKLESAMGKALIVLDEGDSYVTMSSTQDTLLGRKGIDELHLDGQNKSRLVFTGTSTKNLGCNDNGLLVIKNCNIAIAISKSAISLSYPVLPLTGRVRFENCHFEHSVYLKATTDAEFINCSFFSEVSSKKMYPIWVDNGNAKFINCVFTGARGLKIHEFAGTEDVGTVVVDGCTFDNLAQKPGIVIGVFNNSVDNVSIMIKNSKFLHCKAWDTVGSIEGVDGFYEADQYTTEYEFITLNNTITFP